MSTQKLVHGLFIAALLIIARKWKQPKCFFGEWINKMCSIYTMGYYSVIKTNEVLIHAPTRMSPVNMLSERSQSQKIT